MEFPRYYHFGEGLFETFKVENGKLPPYFGYHYERLKRGAEFFKIPHPTFGEFKKFVETRLRDFKNQANPLYVKVLLLSIGEGYYGGEVTDYRLEIVVKPLKIPEGQLVLTISPYRKHSQNPIWHFKTLTELFVQRFGKKGSRFAGFLRRHRFERKGTCNRNLIGKLLLLKGRNSFNPSGRGGIATRSHP